MKHWNTIKTNNATNFRQKNSENDRLATLPEYGVEGHHVGGSHGELLVPVLGDQLHALPVGRVPWKVLCVQEVLAYLYSGLLYEVDQYFLDN